MIIDSTDMCMHDLYDHLYDGTLVDRILRLCFEYILLSILSQVEIHFKTIFIIGATVVALCVCICSVCLPSEQKLTDMETTFKKYAA